MSQDESHPPASKLISDPEIIPSTPHKNVLDRIRLTHPLLYCKTPFCKHDKGCLENTLFDSAKSFAYGYGINTAISLIGLVLRTRKLDMM